MSTIVAGRPPSAQVAGTRGTVYRSEGWGSSPSERAIARSSDGPR